MKHLIIILLGGIIMSACSVAKVSVNDTDYLPKYETSQLIIGDWDHDSSVYDDYTFVPEDEQIYCFADNKMFTIKERLDIKMSKYKLKGNTICLFHKGHCVDQAQIRYLDPGRLILETTFEDSEHKWLYLTRNY